MFNISKRVHPYVVEKNGTYQARFSNDICAARHVEHLGRGATMTAPDGEVFDFTDCTRMIPRGPDAYRIA